MLNLTFLLKELKNISTPINNSSKNNLYIDKSEEIFGWIIFVFIILTLYCCIARGAFVSESDREHNYQQRIRSRLEQ